MTQKLQRSLIFIFLISLFQILPNQVLAGDRDLEYAKHLSGAFQKTAQKITPAVVNISTSSKVKRGMRGQQMPPDQFFDLFRDFFGDDAFKHSIPQQNPEGRMQQGLGTGVIIDNKGHILTNNHVIGNADEVTVRLHDKRTFTAEIIGTDKRTDLAVIKIDADNLTSAKLGDSDSLQIGEWVLAAGNPFGLDNTITSGIVSAKGRSIMGGSAFEDFIQTDAAINPGNSGGPLVNLEGEVVGINTAIFSRSGGYMGIGFAIPINLARSVMESLISSGHVVRGWLGVVIQNLTEDLAQSFNYPSTDGALVGHVQEDGPAERGGLKQGDIIIGFNGKEVKDVNQLRNAVAATQPNTKVKVDVIRDGRKKSLRVKIDELKSQDQQAAITIDKEEELDLGIRVEQLTPEIASRLRSKQEDGIIITAVQPGSIAARSGLQVRDIIIKANGKRIKDIDDFREVVNEKSIKKGILLIVETQGVERFVSVKGE